ncbi:flagellar biosynthetic protein FliO [Thermosipho melanesiensis]|uniref:flagellar biosynthetic protein FliO n=1 Tax=Thermosipho melanesiensis TaxID=46541 RepID=UPI000321C2F9|nr:flagellar biosynthetic protein FliO [Thermosipho melanesiensis]
MVKNKAPRNIGGRFVSVIERKFITRNSYIVIVRIVDEYYALLVTENGGEVIKKFDSLESGDFETKDFKFEFFKNIVKKGEKK